MKNHLILFSFLFLYLSCKQAEETAIPPLKTTPEFIDFHQQFYHSNNPEFEKLKKKYPYLFPIATADSIWRKKQKNTEDLLLLKKVDSVFGNFKNEQKELTELFKHLHYYFPEFNPPKTFTLITNLDYEHAVTYKDSLLFLSLDMYLGRNSEVYQSFPKYISSNYTKKQLPLDVAAQITAQLLPPRRENTFLEKILYHGKKMHVLKNLLPSYSEQELMGYTKQKYNWIVANESLIWAYFIENELLFSADHKLDQRFNQQAPFSKFYLDIDKQTPDRVGVWMGWKIVKSYLKHSHKDLSALLQLDAQQLFRNSKYKPQK
jgi:hypothetical protein